MSISLSHSFSSLQVLLSRIKPKQLITLIISNFFSLQNHTLPFMFEKLLLSLAERAEEKISTKNV